MVPLERTIDEAAAFKKVARPSRSGLPDVASGEPEPETQHALQVGLDPSSLRIQVGENLPHWTCDSAIYHVSFRLADALPATIRDGWLRERKAIVAVAMQLGRELSEDEEKRLDYLYSERVAKALDAGHGTCCLARHDVAPLIAQALCHFAGDRYLLHAWCIMPNHVHAIVQPSAGHELSAIVHSWKSFTAHTVNRILGRSGALWQHDAYNRIIRSAKEYRFQLRYVWENPDKAGLADWPWRGCVEAGAGEG